MALHQHGSGHNLGMGLFSQPLGGGASTARPFFSQPLGTAQPDNEQSFLSKLLSMKGGPKFDKFISILQNPELMRLLGGGPQAEPLPGIPAPGLLNVRGGLLGRRA